MEKIGFPNSAETLNSNFSMSPRSFRIFKKKKGLYIYPEQWGAIILTTFVFSIIYLEPSFGYELKYRRTIFAIIWGLYMFGYTISCFFRYEKELGTYSGSLSLFEEKIIVDDKAYDLSKIKKLSFLSSTVRGKHISSRFTFSPMLSNGLSSRFTLTLKSGQKIQDNFLQTESNRLKHCKEILVHYHKKGIVSWHQLLSLLEIDGYQKIQEFKKEINENG